MAVNPFKMLNLYGIDYIETYFKPSYLQEPPHVYAAAMDCYQTLVRENENASVVISGESGAG